MIKVYAIFLVAGVVGLLVVILGGALADNLDRPDLDPVERLGAGAKPALGGILGFAMGGMSAEFSPLDFSWQVSLVIAAAASAIATWWVRYSLASRAEA